MRDYQLYALPKETFQNLIYHVCKRILGDGTINFSSGADGGRDAKFIGKANSFPSISAPWEGKFVIQAKGGGEATSLCSDRKFEKEIEEKEIPKVKSLFESGEIDKYILFTSRKLGGNTQPIITERIKQNTGLLYVWVGGREFITEEINSYPELVKICNLSKFVSPPRLHPSEIKKVIEGFDKCKEDITGPISRVVDNLDYTDKIIKNNLNNLSEAYFEYIKESSLSYFREIDNFLSDPKNVSLKKSYLNSADEIQSKVTIHRGDYEKFEELFELIYDIILEKCPELVERQRVVNLFLHHMYWNCKIGRGK